MSTTMSTAHHLLRLIDQAIDWSFIYDLVIDKYSADNGRPSMDPGFKCRMNSFLLSFPVLCQVVIY